MANRLKPEKKRTVLSLLLEGMSIRSVERVTAVHRDTIMRLMIRAGNHCWELHDRLMRNLTFESLELDEVWCFVGKKQRNVQPDEYDQGDAFVFTALDAKSKLIPSYRVGKRDGRNANRFMKDLASRVTGRVQINTDGFRPYPFCVSGAFGSRADHAVIVKNYATVPVGRGRYSPPVVSSVTKTPARGRPRPDLSSTSYVERSNLNIRSHNRRLTRLTLSFSKKLENLWASLDLYFLWYNFVRVHRTLKATPAMAAGLASEPWSIDRLVPAA